MSLLSLLPAAFQIGTGAYDALRKKDIPAWYEESYDQAKLLADEGLTPEQLSKMRVAYAPGISRGLSERRNRAASLNASRGRTGSSYGNEQILNVPTTEETIAPILANADQRARSEGRQMLMGLTGGRMQLDAENDAVTSQGLSSTGTGAQSALGVLNPQENPLQDALISFLNQGQGGGGGGQTATGGFDFDSLTDDQLQQLIAMLTERNANTELPPFQQNQPIPQF